MLKNRIEFLENCFAKIKTMLNKTKERIANFFNEEIYLAGKTIFDENKMGGSAFLIKEGTVLMISRKSPVCVMYTLI